MKIQVNSDKTIAVDIRMIRYIRGEVAHRLQRFAGRLTRTEVHLSDVNGRKRGTADKRCLIEVRPAGARPRAVSGQAAPMSIAVQESLDKMARRLGTFFGRRGKAVVSMGADAAGRMPRRTSKRKRARGAGKQASGKKALAKSAKQNFRGPKKKRIYQARRKPWPAKTSPGLEIR